MQKATRRPSDLLAVCKLPNNRVQVHTVAIPIDPKATMREESNSRGIVYTGDNDRAQFTALPDVERDGSNDHCGPRARSFDREVVLQDPGTPLACNGVQGATATLASSATVALRNL